MVLRVQVGRQQSFPTRAAAGAVVEALGEPGRPGPARSKGSRTVGRERRHLAEVDVEAEGLPVHGPAGGGTYRCASVGVEWAPHGDRDNPLVERHFERRTVEAEVAGGYCAAPVSGEIGGHRAIVAGRPDGAVTYC
jgi:hypothetical protein